MAVELEALIRIGEGARAEFKAQWSEAALETLAAFANGQGGTLLIGVDDDGHIIGWQGSDKDLRATSDRIADALRVQPPLEVRVLDGKRVLVIEVASSQTPVAYHGRYYRRVGNTTREIPPEELGRLFIEKWGVTWDSVTGDYSVDEIDPDTVQQFVRLSKPRLPYVTENEPIESLLRKLDLLVDGKLTRGLSFSSAGNHSDAF